VHHCPIAVAPALSMWWNNKHIPIMEGRTKYYSATCRPHFSTRVHKTVLKRVLEALCMREETQSVKLTTNLHLVQRLIMNETTTPLAKSLRSTGCGRKNSHISKNHCGVPKAGSGVWSIPLGRVHNKVFSCLHAMVG
jgi:hypothetical protein